MPFSRGTTPRRNRRIHNGLPGHRVTGLPGDLVTRQPGNPNMKFTDLFIKRPVLAMVVNLVILIAGLQAIRSLVVRQFPRSDMANIVVNTAYVGANADLVR